MAWFETLEHILVSVDNIPDTIALLDCCGERHLYLIDNAEGLQFERAVRATTVGQRLDGDFLGPQ